MTMVFPEIPTDEPNPSSPLGGACSVNSAAWFAGPDQPPGGWLNTYAAPSEGYVGS